MLLESLYMGELSECDEVNLTEYGGGKNWKSVGAITTAALTNQGRVPPPPTTLHMPRQYGVSAVNQHEISLAQVSL
jgi:hypothetical protein